jgi:hypothetical protein
MNPFVREVVGSVIRTALAALAGYAVNAGIFSPEDATRYVTATSAVVLAAAWSVYQKYTSRQKLLGALALPQRTSEAHLEQFIAEGHKVAVTTSATTVPQVLS